MTIDELITEYEASITRLQQIMLSGDDEHLEFLDREISKKFQNIMEYKPTSKLELELLTGFLLKYICPDDDAPMSRRIKTRIFQIIAQDFKS